MMKIVNYIKTEVHNPASTLTNLAYILLGLLALSREPVMGSLLIGVGIASTGFHWTRSDCWHKADIVMIYYIFSVLAAWHWLGYAGIPIGLCVGGAAHWSFRDYSRYSQKIIGVLGLLTITPFFLANGWADTLYVLMWFVLAFAAGQFAIFLNPEEDSKEYDAFHAWWHIMSAIGIYYLII